MHGNLFGELLCHHVIGVAVGTLLTNVISSLFAQTDIGVDGDRQLSRVGSSRLISLFAMHFGGN